MWCIVELMGHRKLAGLCTEQVIAGNTMLRIDVYGEKVTEQRERDLLHHAEHGSHVPEDGREAQPGAGEPVRAPAGIR